ncbi:hypothetical protein CCP2SC5_1120005 [Azospirillaceae bacterium]
MEQRQDEMRVIKFNGPGAVFLVVRDHKKGDFRSWFERLGTQPEPHLTLYPFKMRALKKRDVDGKNKSGRGCKKKGISHPWFPDSDRQASDLPTFRRDRHECR